MRAALYHRVSTTDQNPALARQELQAAAQRLGATVVLDCEEAGSGARNDRPGLQNVLAAARRGKLDVVLVWAIDRFGRSTLDLLGNIRQLTEAGVRFRAVSQGIDVAPNGDPTSQLVLTVLAGVAQWERSMIVERTRLGLAHARAKGKHLGRPRTVSVDGDRARALRAAGRSWSETAAELGCTVAAARRAVADVQR
jgi:putative DNA-invertase from lambdoid prophage Rac